MKYTSCKIMLTITTFKNNQVKKSDIDWKYFLDNIYKFPKSLRPVAP